MNSLLVPLGLGLDQTPIWLQMAGEQNVLAPLAILDTVPKSSIADLISLSLKLLGAVGILALGWVIGKLASRLIRRVLRKTNVDHELSELVADGRHSQFSVAQLTGLIVEWVILIFAIVAALNTLNLTLVSEPLNQFLNEIFAFLPNLGSAGILAGVAWVLAKLVKGLVTQLATRLGLDQQLNSAANGELNQLSVSETLGNALYWFVFLFFLPLILDVLGLQGPLAPVQSLLDQILSAIPQIAKAVAVGAVGWFIAQILRNVVTNLPAATGIDRLGQRMGLGETAASSRDNVALGMDNSPAPSAHTPMSLSSLAGLLVYIFTLVPVIIAALRELNVSAISDPATTMLGQFMAAIPLIFTAGLIMTVSFFVGKLIADLASNLLSGFGFDRLITRIGLTTPTEGSNTPSKIAGTIVLVGTMMIALVAAVDVLGLPSLRDLSVTLLQLSGQVFVGILIFGAGLFTGNWSADLIKSSGMREGILLATSARVAILIFSGAMALRQIGVAADIVNLTFGLLLGAIAVAIAIAFGLGGRDVAAEELREWLQSLKR